MILNHIQVCNYAKENNCSEEASNSQSQNFEIFANDEASTGLQIPTPDTFGFEQIISQAANLYNTGFLNTESFNGQCEIDPKELNDFAFSQLTQPEPPATLPSIEKQKTESTEEEEKEPSVKKVGVRKGKFSVEDDNTLKELVAQHGRNWALISKYMPYKDRKQLRERFDNFLSKKLNRKRFSSEEDKKIIDIVEKIGTKFYKIAEELEGRTAIMIKNHYYSKLQEKIKRKSK